MLILWGGQCSYAFGQSLLHNTHPRQKGGSSAFRGLKHLATFILASAGRQ